MTVLRTSVIAMHRKNPKVIHEGLDNCTAMLVWDGYTLSLVLTLLCTETKQRGVIYCLMFWVQFIEGNSLMKQTLPYIPPPG